MYSRDDSLISFLIGCFYGNNPCMAITNSKIDFQQNFCNYYMSLRVFYHSKERSETRLNLKQSIGKGLISGHNLYKKIHSLIRVLKISAYN